MAFDQLTVAAIVAVLYAISYFLSYRKIIQVALHRKIWNAALVLTFIITALSALLYVFSDYLGSFKLFVSAYDLHTYAGVAFLLIALFHALWHIPYFKSYLAKN